MTAATRNTEELVTVERRGAVAIVTLNNPKALNALTAPMGEKFVDVRNTNVTLRLISLQPYNLNPNLPLHITYNLNQTMPLHIYQIVHPSTLGICRSPEVNCRSVKACFFIMLVLFRCADEKPTFSPFSFSSGC